MRSGLACCAAARGAGRRRRDDPTRGLSSVGTRSTASQTSTHKLAISTQVGRVTPLRAALPFLVGSARCADRRPVQGRNNGVRCEVRAGWLVAPLSAALVGRVTPLRAALRFGRHAIHPRPKFQSLSPPVAADVRRRITSLSIPPAESISAFQRFSFSAFAISAFPHHEVIPQHQHIHFGAEETIKRFLGFADPWFISVFSISAFYFCLK